MDKYSAFQYNLAKLKAEQRDIDFVLEQENEKIILDHLLMIKHKNRRREIRKQILKIEIEVENSKFDIKNRALSKTVQKQ